VRPDSELHRGFLGPLLRAEVGDTLLVTVRNRLPADLGMNISAHPHGVRYTKSNEGTPYSDGTMGADKLDDNIGPGGQYTCAWRPLRACRQLLFTSNHARRRCRRPPAADTWVADETSGPLPDSATSSVVWFYHSHVNEVADVSAGLVGHIIVTRAGWAHSDGSPVDVDREFVVHFAVVDESQSQLMMRNIQRYLGLTGAAATNLLSDSGFAMMNYLHSMNGYGGRCRGALSWRRGGALAAAAAA
jgi:hypothetical protein